MDQLICIIRSGNSFCLLQTGQIVLKFPQLNFESLPGSDASPFNYDENLINVLIQEKICSEVKFLGIVNIKSANLPVTKKPIFAFYVLLEIASHNLKATDDGDWLWQNVKNLEQKTENGQFLASDLEILRSIESRDFVGTKLTTVRFASVIKQWTEQEIVNSLTDRENKFRLAAKYDQQSFQLLAQTFVEFAFPYETMTLEQFSKFLIKIDLPDAKAKSQRYFRAFDDKKERRLTFLNFVLGCAALEPHTGHGGDAGETRCRYIFRYYCQKHEFNMAFGEFVTMIDDICFVKLSSAKDSVKEKERTSLTGHYCENFTLGKFLEKVGTLQLRGTSVLFRSPFSVQDQLKSFYETSTMLKVKEEPPMDVDNQDQRPVVSVVKLTTKKDAGEQCNILKNPDQPSMSFRYALSKHVMQITSRGTVVELFKNVKNGKSHPCSSDNVATESEDVFNPTEFVKVANELLNALDYFEKPYLVQGQKKSPLSWGKVDVKSVAECILLICNAVYKLFAKEPRCLEIDDPVYILGDLHGNLQDLFMFESRLWPLGPKFCPAKILFLGDYVDRGNYGVEAIMYLFAQKILAPDKIYLLRGNHEIRGIQQLFTFYKECTQKFPGSCSKTVFDAINLCFDALPYAAVVNKKVFCVHGGIPTPSLLGDEDSLAEAINKIPCPLNFDPNHDDLAWELMWNDPIWQDDNTYTFDVNGFAPNRSRETGHVFSSEALQLFLTRHGLTHVVRAHQLPSDAGFEVRYSSKLLTVFSSSSFSGMDSESACILLERGNMRLIQIGKDVANGKLKFKHIGP